MFKFGIIGAGYIAHKFCGAARRVENCEVAAVSSKSIDRAKEFAEKEEIPYYSDSYDKMLTESKLDAVYIATTHNFHHENALLCLNHNLPILIEKPMCVNRKQAEDVFNIAKEKKLFVMEAMWTRFLPNMVQAKKWIESGEIGEIAAASCPFGFKANPDPNGRLFNSELAGGPLYDIGVYAIEMMTYLINKPVIDVTTMTLPAKTGVDMTDSICIKFDGCIANILLTFAADVRPPTMIWGTDGYISIPHIVSGDECFLHKNDEPVQHFKHERENGFEYEIEETIKCVRNGLLESPIVPHADTLTCCDIFDMIKK